MIDVRKEVERALSKLTITADSLVIDKLLLELTKRGISIVPTEDVIDPPDEHLRSMKKMRKRLDEAIEDEGCAPRDLASLSRRYIEVQRDISTMEEQIRQENQRSGRNNRNGKAKAKVGEKFDAADV